MPPFHCTASNRGSSHTCRHCSREPAKAVHLVHWSVLLSLHTEQAYHHYASSLYTFVITISWQCFSSMLPTPSLACMYGKGTHEYGCCMHGREAACMDLGQHAWNWGPPTRHWGLHAWHGGLYAWHWGLHASAGQHIAWLDFRVWDGTTGKQLCSLQGHKGRGVWRCLLHPDQDRLITAGADSSIKIWRLADWMPADHPLAAQTSDAFTLPLLPTAAGGLPAASFRICR